MYLIFACWWKSTMFDVICWKLQITDFCNIHRIIAFLQSHTDFYTLLEVLVNIRKNCFEFIGKNHLLWGWRQNLAMGVDIKRHCTDVHCYHQHKENGAFNTMCLNRISDSYYHILFARIITWYHSTNFAED